VVEKLPEAEARWTDAVKRGKERSFQRSARSNGTSCLKAPAACIAVGRIVMNSDWSDADFHFWITLGLGIGAMNQRLSP